MRSVEGCNPEQPCYSSRGLGKVSQLQPEGRSPGRVWTYLLQRASREVYLESGPGPRAALDPVSGLTTTRITLGSLGGGILTKA